MCSSISEWHSIRSNTFLFTPQICCFITGCSACQQEISGSLNPSTPLPLAAYPGNRFRSGTKLLATNLALCEASCGYAAVSSCAPKRPCLVQELTIARVLHPKDRSPHPSASGRENSKVVDSRHRFAPWPDTILVARFRTLYRQSISFFSYGAHNRTLF